MYQVTVHHHDKDWVRGNLEDKMELVAKEVFNARKNAKSYIEDDIKRHRFSKVNRDYHLGNETSLVWAYTGVTWQHENSGETMHEFYRYELKKVKAR